MKTIIIKLMKNMIKFVIKKILKIVKVLHLKQDQKNLAVKNHNFRLYKNLLFKTNN